MHDDRALVEARLVRVKQRVEERIHTVVARVDATAWRAPGEPVPFEVARRAQYTDFPAGTWWGPAWSTWWLRLHGTVPQEQLSRRLELRVDLGFVGDWAGNQSEGMVFTEAGVPLKALNPMNRSIALNFGGPGAASAVSGAALLGDDGAFDLYVEAAANPDMSTLIGQVSLQGDTRTATAEPVWRFGGAQVVFREEDVWQLWCDIDVIDGLMRELPEDSTRRAVLLRGLESACDIIDSGDIAETAGRARQCLAPLLGNGANTSAQQMTAIGHAHIDSAWLWPVRETRRKVIRTFSNVVALADAYPDFHFACTTAQHYAWLKEDSPPVFARVLDSIRRGQWHPVGGMWVESDTNLPGGESLVRQLTSGLRWMRSELGVRPDCLWLPDSFGYSAALPQIAALAGMRWFFTQKISWNRTNTFPHHTFWWEGLDGTRLWTHFPPVDCYDSTVSPEQVIYAEKNFKEKGVATRSVLPFGYGDGGGGPVAEMMERARRLADTEDAPRVVPGSPQDFFEAARADYPSPPVWSGELYLEFHRGVYSTQAALKRGNRRVEHALSAVELLAAMALLADPDFVDPGDELERLWRRALLLQFHDILPGSSTAWVNREAAAEYEQLRTDIDDLVRRLWRALPAAPGGASVLNAAPLQRREVVETPDGLSVLEVAPSSITPQESAIRPPVSPVTLRRDGDLLILDNALVSVHVNAMGNVVAIQDLVEDRDVLLPGQHGNVLRLHPDHPSDFDAWELEEHYRRQFTELDRAESVTVAVEDPLRVRVDVTRAFGRSRVVQSISLDADSRMVDFEVDVDWREREHVLKVGFPLDVRARNSSAEIQFGHVERPVAPNTSWDAARFETSGHRWLLLQEPGYGVAIANDSSYGHDVMPLSPAGDAANAGVMASLTLLRAPQSPDPLSDLGAHRIRYGLALGADLTSAHAAGIRLNQPLTLLPGRARAAVLSLTPHAGSSHAVVDAVKPAFDGSGDVVIRLHEAGGGRSTVELRLGFDADHVDEVDLLEEIADAATQQLPDGTLPAGEPLRLRLRPFQILTLRFRRAS